MMRRRRRPPRISATSRHRGLGRGREGGRGSRGPGGGGRGRGGRRQRGSGAAVAAGDGGRSLGRYSWWRWELRRRRTSEIPSRQRGMRERESTTLELVYGFMDFRCGSGRLKAWCAVKKKKKKNRGVRASRLR